MLRSASGCWAGIILASLGVAGPAAQAAESAAPPDILIADFEGSTYGEGWKSSGDAFGPGPAQGALAGQMPVSGFEGHGLVNSFFHGDKTTGSLESPPFKIERKHINFLLGGGNHPDQTCVNLIVDGKVARSSPGIDSEHLEWETWHVQDLLGKTAAIEIIDRATDGWGHINVDQIAQSDRAQIEPIEAAALYHERYRPQFHFTAAKNWLNDPNGLVFYQGEYHLFFQHNPTGINWGNMTWGHAVSSDLVHWRQLEHALLPDKLGTMFSGSAVVDWNNTTGFKTGAESPLVAIYTSAGGSSAESKGARFTQSIAWSNDRGRAWQKYEQNPVLPHIVGGNRDPKVIWHEPTKRWIMALFLDGEKYALFGSPNLKQWEKLSDLPAIGGSECPDLFPLAAPGSEQPKWIFWAANNRYLIGEFDGVDFRPDGPPQQFEYGANYYAAQTYSDIPSADGRRIQIAWMRGGRYPRMPFNQQMSFPSELTLRQAPAGLRLCRWPVKEIEALRLGRNAANGESKPNAGVPGAESGCLDLVLEIEPQESTKIVVEFPGASLEYLPPQHELRLLGKTAKFTPEDGVLQLRILLDRSSIEVFAGVGEVTMSSCFLPLPEEWKYKLRSEGGPIGVTKLEAWELASAWPEN
jgi:sucrose-6-phosphate hydrolase SacC (GH32 family)